MFQTTTSHNLALYSETADFFHDFLSNEDIAAATTHDRPTNFTHPKSPPCFGMFGKKDCQKELHVSMTMLGTAPSSLVHFSVIPQTLGST